MDNEEQAPAALSVIESQERANIDMLIATAKKYPRDIVRVRRAMEAMATLDEETAEGCNYHLERNGKAIDGPSVRMAEIAVACYQNIRAGGRVIGNDEKVITGQAFCHDLENNTFIAWETQRRITDKAGRTYGDDMQVTTGNAAAAIAFRNAVFKIIPAILIKPVAEKARQVAVGDLRTLSERRTRALKKFAAIRVKEEQILEFLGRASVEQIDIADVEKLFGVFTAIKEGSTTIEEQFPIATVKPHFADQTEQAEAPKRRAGRPPKAARVELPETASAASSSAGQAPTAAVPAKDDLFSDDESVNRVVQETIIIERLKSENISLKSFLELLHKEGLLAADVELADIEAAKVGIECVGPSDFELVFRNLDDIVHTLKK